MGLSLEMNDFQALASAEEEEFSATKVRKKHVLSRIPLQVEAFPPLSYDLSDRLVLAKISDCYQAFVAGDCYYVWLHSIKLLSPYLPWMALQSNDVFEVFPELSDLVGLEVDDAQVISHDLYSNQLNECSPLYNMTTTCP